MVGEVYRDWHIMVSAQYDDTTRSWLPRVRIITTEGLRKANSRGATSIDLEIPKRFPSSHRAEAFGLRTGKAWLNRQINWRSSDMTVRLQK